MPVRELVARYTEEQGRSAGLQLRTDRADGGGHFSYVRGRASAADDDVTDGASDFRVRVVIDPQRMIGETEGDMHRARRQHALAAYFLPHADAGVGPEDLHEWAERRSRQAADQHPSIVASPRHRD
jgi:hypothetical protein